MKLNLGSANALVDSVNIKFKLPSFFFLHLQALPSDDLLVTTDLGCKPFLESVFH